MNKTLYSGKSAAFADKALREKEKKIYDYDNGYIREFQHKDVC